MKPWSEGAWQGGESLRGKGRNESLMVEEIKAPRDTQGSQTGGVRKGLEGSGTGESSRVGADPGACLIKVESGPGEP